MVGECSRGMYQKNYVKKKIEENCVKGSKREKSRKSCLHQREPETMQHNKNVYCVYWLLIWMVGVLNQIKVLKLEVLAPSHNSLNFTHPFWKLQNRPCYTSLKKKRVDASVTSYRNRKAAKFSHADWKWIQLTTSRREKFGYTARVMVKQYQIEWAQGYRGIEFRETKSFLNTV